MRVLEVTGGQGWYQAMAEMQPWPLLDYPEEGARWDARTIARAGIRWALRRAARVRGGATP